MKFQKIEKNKKFLKSIVGNNKKWLILGIFIFLIYLCFKLFFYFDKLEEQKLVQKNLNIERLSQENLAKLQPGDIILRRGYGFFSDMISKKLNNSVFDVTHAGILYKDGENWKVIHSLSSKVSDFDGVQEQNLQEFLFHSMPNKLLIVRVKDISFENQQKIVERAQFYLKKQIPFDENGIIDNTEALYCTELIWQILDNDLKIINLPKENPKRKEIFYSMKSMYDENYFDIVVNGYFSEENTSKKTEN